MGLYEESKLARHASAVGLGFEDDDTIGTAEAEVEFNKAQDILEDVHEDIKDTVTDLREASDAADKIEDVLEDASDVVEENPEEVTPAYVEAVEKHAVNILTKVYSRAGDIVAEYGFESRRVEINALMRKNGRLGLESARQTRQSIAIDGYYDLRAGLEGTLSKMKESVAAAWETLLKKFTMYLLKIEVYIKSAGVFVSKLEKRAKTIKEKYGDKPFDPVMNESDSKDVMSKLAAIYVVKLKTAPEGTVTINGNDLLAEAKNICEDYLKINKTLKTLGNEIATDGKNDTEVDNLLSTAASSSFGSTVNATAYVELLGLKSGNDGTYYAFISKAIGTSLGGVSNRSHLEKFEVQAVSEKIDIDNVTVKTSDVNTLITLVKSLAKATKDGDKIGKEIANEFKNQIDNLKAFRRKRDKAMDTDKKRDNEVARFQKIYEENSFHTPGDRYHTYTSTITGLIKFVDHSLNYIDKKGKKEK